MTGIRISSGDIDCLYLAAPGSSNKSQFGKHLESLGIKLPPNLSIRTMVARGWLRPRLRVSLPAAALLSWRNFPKYSAIYDDSCPPGDAWALNAWCASTCSWHDIDRPIEKLWMHWLDDPQDETGIRARANAIDPSDSAAEPLSFVHPNDDRTVLPWIDFLADWQAYHIAELVRSAVFTLHGVTDQFHSVDTRLQKRTREFDPDAKDLAAQWEQRGAFFDIVSGYRTILAHCCIRDSFAEDARAGARAFAAQRGIDADFIRTGIKEVILRAWQRWASAPPIDDPRLMLRLQQDLQYALDLWSALSGQPVDPFDPFWYSKSFSRGESAMLIDALPHEEWIARRDFPQGAVRYQRGFPQPYFMGEEQFANLLARHWEACPPLRRFCLAWVRLHDQLQSQDKGRHADQIIAANERIEQFNLIGLHTERILRHVASVQTPPTGKQSGSNAVMRDAIKRSLTIAATPVSITDPKLDGWLKQHTSLHAMPDLGRYLCQPSTFATGDTAADQLITAHIHALIARNYAAHHDYLDDSLIYPNSDPTQPHSGAALMSSCLLVVVAALHSLPAQSAPQP